MIPLSFVRLPDVALGLLLSQPARTMSSTRNVYVRSLVSGTKGLERRDPQQNARTFQSNGLERLSDIIIESCVTGKGVFLVCQKPLGEHWEKHCIVFVSP
jgi:hypothetical protein